MANAAESAASYPSKPVRAIVGYAPGGGSDIMGRIMAQELTKSLGQQMIVENRAGAAQNVAAELIARSPADGYTLFMSSAALGVNISLYPKLNYHPVRDFAPAGLFAISPNLLLTHPSLPPKSVKEFIAFAKQYPGKLNYSSSGSGSTQAGKARRRPRPATSCSSRASRSGPRRPLPSCTARGCS